MFSNAALQRGHAPVETPDFALADWFQQML
jgi:hypothetical protein